jgi:acetyltransferase-like isoleucine patch superfamily enzyme
MASGSRIGEFNIIRSVDRVELFENARLGSFNYVTGYSTRLVDHFGHIRDRKCEFVIGASSAVTSRHYIDCTGGVYVGEFSTIAGVRSQILTHSIDLQYCRQDAQPVIVGNFCFVGTGCVLLMGSELPSYSVLGAMSLLTENLGDESMLYGGVPAKRIKRLNASQVSYFSRENGFVV